MPSFPKKIKHKDAEWVHALLSVCLPEKGWSMPSLQDFFDHGGEGFGIEPEACLLIKGAAGYGEVVAIATHPDRQGRGYASLLFDALRGENEYHEISLEVRSTNHAAIALYKKVGFSEIGKRYNYYKDGGDALIFSYSG